MKTNTARSSRLTVSLQVAAAAAGLPGVSRIRAVIRQTLAAADCSGGEVTVRFVDEAESAALNNRYRNKPSPTNVLSFDYCDTPDTVQIFGDIAICTPVLCREAAAAGKSVQAHALHMIVHAVLHLAGYRHDTAAAAAAMEQTEIAVLTAFAVDNPYQP